jgi:hypothetical protein
MRKIRALALSLVAAATLTGGVATMEIASTGPRITSGCIVPRFDATGKTDVTAKMNALFSNARDGSCIRFPRPSSRGGRYRVSGQILLRGKADLRVFGNSAQIFIDTHIHTPLFSVQRSNNVLVQGLKLRGAEEDCTDRVTNSVAEEFEAGMEIKWSDDVTFNRNIVKRVSGDGAFLGWGNREDGWAHGQIPCPGCEPVFVERSHNLRITNNEFDCVGRQGIALAHLDGVLLEGNIWDRVALIAIDLEHYAVDNLSIRGNHFKRIHEWIFIGQVPGDNWYVGFNRSDEPWYALIRYGVRPQNVLFEGNAGGGLAGGPFGTYGPGVPFVSVHSPAKVRVIGNRQHFAPDGGQFHLPAFDLRPPMLDHIPGTSRSTIEGVCHFYAEGNDFTGANRLWDGWDQTQFPEGCAWVDGGGNTL